MFIRIILCSLECSLESYQNHIIILIIYELRFDPKLRFQSFAYFPWVYEGFLWVLGLQPTSQNHSSRWISYTKTQWALYNFQNLRIIILLTLHDTEHVKLCTDSKTSSGTKWRTWCWATHCTTMLQCPLFQPKYPEYIVLLQYSGCFIPFCVFSLISLIRHLLLQSKQYMNTKNETVY